MNNYVRLEADGDRISGIYNMNGLLGAGYLGRGYDQAADRISAIAAECNVEDLTLQGSGAPMIKDRLEHRCHIQLK